MVEYCVGFAFDERRQQILLIHKQKPDWQKGKINGIGGKIEKDETPIQAMVREFKEETNIKTNLDEWWPSCILLGRDWKVHSFYSFNNDIFKFESITCEPCEIFSVYNLPLNVIPNLNWLIPMCLDSMVNTKDTVINFW